MTDYTHEILDILSHIHFFDSLDEIQLSSISEQMTTVFFKQDETIFEEGMDADGLYIVLSGRVSLQREDGNDIQEISIKHRGDYFGEEGLTLDGVREVTAVALSSVIAIHITENQLIDLMDTYPIIVEPIKLTIKSYYLFLKHLFKWRAPRESTSLSGVVFGTFYGDVFPDQTQFHYE